RGWPGAGDGRAGVPGRGAAGAAGPGRACCLFKRCRISCRGGTTGLAAGWPAKFARALAGRGAMGAPGVNPGAAGRGGRCGIGAPGTAEPPAVTPADAAPAEPGATTCVGGCAAREGRLGAADGGAETGRDGKSGTDGVRAL